MPIERPHFGFDGEQSEDVSAAVAAILQALDTTGEGGVELETWKLVVAVSGQVVTKLAHRGENLTAYAHHLGERTLPDGRTVWALRIMRRKESGEDGQS